MKNYHHNMPYSWHTKAAITMAYSAVLMRENSYCHASFAILMQITTLCHAHDAQQLPPQWQTVPCPWQNKHDLHSDLLCHAHDNETVPLQWHTLPCSWQQKATLTETYFAMLMTAKATRLFWPPDRLDTGRRAKSPLTPKLPSCALYTSVVFPETITTSKFVCTVHSANLEANDPSYSFWYWIT